MIFKGYAKGENKQPIQSMSDNALIDYDAAEQFDSFGGKLNDDVIDISFDTKELADKFWDMSKRTIGIASFRKTVKMDICTVFGEFQKAGILKMEKTKNLLLD